MDNVSDAMLMKLNRASLVEQINSLGFTTVDENTPLSELAECMKWAGGLRDLRLAAFHRSSKVYRFFTRAEWEDLSSFTRAPYMRIGLVIRAYGQQFLIARSDAHTAAGSYTMQWHPTNADDVRGLTNFSGMPSMYDDMDGQGNTDKILAFGEEMSMSFPAAENARAYKATTVADGGADDPTTWSLPAIGQLWIMYKCYNEINAEMAYYFGTSAGLSNDWYWSSSEQSSSLAWYVYMSIGYVASNNKSTAGRVRPVARVPVSALSGSAI